MGLFGTLVGTEDAARALNDAAGPRRGRRLRDGCHGQPRKARVALHIFFIFLYARSKETKSSTMLIRSVAYWDHISVQF